MAGLGERARWTREIPTESGWYWYRHANRRGVVYFDVAGGWITRCGTEQAAKPSGEFWPVKLNMPQ